MKQDEFKKWLVAKGHTDLTASSRVSSAKRVEEYLGDLDALFSDQDLNNILKQFAYSTEDERAERPNPSPVPIDGVLRTGLASIRQALTLYHSFFTEQMNMPDKAAHQALLDRLTSHSFSRPT
jgi:5-methylcytosine-specific restriction enzyme B